MNPYIAGRKSRVESPREMLGFPDNPARAVRVVKNRAEIYKNTYSLRLSASPSAGTSCYLRGPGKDFGSRATGWEPVPL